MRPAPLIVKLAAIATAPAVVVARRSAAAVRSTADCATASTCSGPSGHRSGRGEFVLALRDGLASERLISVRFTEQSGCVVARGETVAVSSGASRRFTSVWVQPAGSDWRCVTHHETEAASS